MIRNVYALDLGTYEIKIYDKKENKFGQEKNVIAIKDKKNIFAVSDPAYEMFEKSPDDIQVIFPMQNGVIAHFNNMQLLLGHLIKNKNHSILGSEYLVAVPTDVTEVEKRAFFDLVSHSEARAKSVRIVERGIADGLGIGLDIFNEKGIFIVNLGAGITELSILSSGGLVLNRLLKIGGNSLDSAIVAAVRHNRDFLIGNLTAEYLRKQFGLIGKPIQNEITVSGRSLLTGVPSQISIPASIVRTAMKAPIDECINGICSLLDRTPPDVRRCIDSSGIWLTGGLSHLTGLSTYIQENVGLPVHCTETPELCVIQGLKKILSDKQYYKQLTYSMLDEDYRWLR